MDHFGISDSTINRYKNKGIITTKVRSDAKLNLNGWEIIYIPNDDYGSDYKNEQI